MMDHKMVKKWVRIAPGKIKCSICEKKPATRKKEFPALAHVKAKKNKIIALYHCEDCHSEHIPSSRHYKTNLETV